MHFITFVITAKKPTQEVLCYQLWGAPAMRPPPAHSLPRAVLRNRVLQHRHA